MTTLRLAAGLALTLLAACSPCDTVGVTFQGTCLPERVSPGVPLEIDFIEACGSSCSEPPACTATVDLTIVNVISAQSECLEGCTPTGTCQQRRVTCILPALSEGLAYTVVIPGVKDVRTGEATNIQRRVIAEAGQPANCSCPDPSENPNASNPCKQPLP